MHFTVAVLHLCFIVTKTSEEYDKYLLAILEIDLLFALGIVVFKKSSFQTQGDLIRRHFAGLNIFGNF